MKHLLTAILMTFTLTAYASPENPYGLNDTQQTQDYNHYKQNCHDGFADNCH